MILPIVAFGHPTLRKVAQDIQPDYPGLAELISNMWETMYEAKGVGLAAPQVNRPIRLFVVDADSFNDEYPQVAGFKKVFVNAHILEETGEEWVFNEGCLSIPGINEDVLRPPVITMKYMDENFVERTETFDGITARIIQHEYDHIDGKLFVDRLTHFRKILLKGKLADISIGKVDVSYRMIFPPVKRR
jgi:peptide deformylase